jgi:MFS family permease
VSERQESDTSEIIVSEVPAQLDALPWAGFHTLVVVALGVTWILDGLEVTLAGSLGSALMRSPVLRLTAAEVGLCGSAYLAGAVVGALFFGWLTDRFGRRRLFFVTLGLYMCASAATGLSWDLGSLLLFRFLTGAGIGGEYTAINSTIQELIPARVRGWSDLVVNGSFWVGAALGAGGSVLLLDPAVTGPDFGWRLCFLIGGALAVPIIFMRRWIPESPRWLVTHGAAAQAAAVVRDIRRRIEAGRGTLPELPGGAQIRLRPRDRTGLGEVAMTLLRTYRRRTLVGLSLMTGQAFFYNAIFFTYALVLSEFYGVPADDVGLYIVPFALGNVLGPLLLGRFFDTLGRRLMISLTYVVSGALLAATGYLFLTGLLTGVSQTVAWTCTFFFASAAASSAYLTVSESFPLEIRALAIAVFYAVGTAVGGVAAPVVFGILIGSGSRANVFYGYLFGAVLMVLGGIVQAIWGIAAERRSLEEVARPLSMT